MFRKSVYALAVLFVITGMFLAACGGGGGGQGGSGLQVLDVVPGSGNIQPATSIVIIFNSSMDTSTLSLSGDMEPECDGGMWSTSSLTDDTLTINPDPAQTGLWAEGIGRIITVNVDDVDNRSLSTLTLTYTVDGAAPQVVEYTDNTSPIMENAQIVIKFSESMDPGSLVLGGLMAAADHAAIWSSTLISDDTVTISPTVFWTQGIQQDLTVDAADLAGNSLSTLAVTYEIVVAPLLASASPPNGSVLGGTLDIVIVFSETMDTSSLVLAGTLTSDSFSTAWSNTSYTDDTLTISPSSTWTGGFGLTLSVDAESMAGKMLSTLNLTYDVGMIHVSISSGMDSNTGSRALPMKTIQAGVDIAYLQSVNTVLVENGSYSEAVALAEGVNIQGGYDASWALSPSGITRIMGGLSTAESKYICVEARDVSLSTTVSNLIINGPTPPSGSGESSWAVHIVDSTGVILDDVEIVGGSGGTGAAGTVGSNAAQTKAPAGAVGGNPGSPSSCSELFGAGGAAGTTGDSRSGGAGGNGGQADTVCSSNFNPTSGITGSDAVTSSPGYGTGGAGGVGQTATPPQVGSPGVVGRDGDPGTPGNGGLAGEGLFDTSTLGWDPGGIATDGLSDGTAATGGGGGGGAGGGGTLLGGTYGGGGGGGGAGGLAVGAGGSGGSGGGASMALFAANSSVTLNSVTFTIGNGGRGGRGGAGGLGQPGGDGGAGGDTNGGSSGRELAGGNGGAGGRAGQGGGGGGGAGGEAFGTFTYNTNIIENSVTFQGGTVGTGGNGGAPNGNAGQDGSVIESFDQP